jgi:hypothetical protein
MEWSEAPLIGGFFNSPTETKAQNSLGEQAAAYGKQRAKGAKEGKAAQSAALGLADPYNQMQQGANQRLSQAGAGEQFFGANQGRFGQGGAAQVMFNANQGQMTRPGVGEAYFGQVANQKGPGAAGAAWSAASSLNGPSITERGVAGYQGQLAGASQAELLQRTMGGLQDRNTFSDQAAKMSLGAAQNPNLGQYYDQASKDASQGINRALAAQGLLGSAFGANKAVEMQSRLGAERANREADFGLAARQQATQAASSADANRLGLIQSAAGMAQGADNAQLGRVTAGFGMGQGADQAQLGRLGLMGSLGQAYDQGDLARTLGIGGLGMQAQDAALGRAQFGQNAAMGLDQMDLAKVNAGQNAAMQAQALAQGRDQSMMDNQFRQQQQMQQQQMMWNEMLANRDQAMMDAQLASVQAQNQSAMDSSNRRRGQNSDMLNTVVGGGLSMLSLGLL